MPRHTVVYSCVVPSEYSQSQQQFAGELQALVVVPTCLMNERINLPEFSNKS